MAISVMNTVSYGTDTIHWFVVGPISTNCYAYVSDGECLVVDPGFDGAALAQQLADQNITTIVATHGHGDHVGGVAELMRPSTAFLINEKDVAMAQSATAPGHRPGESLTPRERCLRATWCMLVPQAFALLRHRGIAVAVSV